MSSPTEAKRSSRSTDEVERERVGYFRQRWAQENFRSQHSLPNTLVRGDQLSDLSAESPPRADTRVRRLQKRSWRDNLRFSPTRFLDLRAQPPISSSNAGTSFRSPVDSNDNTIYSEEPSTPPEAPSPPNSTSIMRPPEKATISKWLDELYIISWLTFFSLMGTLARLGVEAITQYPDAPVSSRVLWANLGGSFIMGFLVEDRNLFGLPVHLIPSSIKEDQPSDESQLYSAHLKHKKTIPLYVGLTTGFCGSFTSFSSFIRDAFLALTNALPQPSPTSPFHSPSASPSSRSGGFSFLALAAILILHPATSLGALKTGAHFAFFLRPIMPRQIFPTNVITHFLNPLFVLIGLGSWLGGAIVLTIVPPSSGPSPVNWRARATIPLLFAPVGCIIRYWLAKYLNRPSTPNFPWGTFIANIFGTYVLGMAWDLQHMKGFGANPNASWDGNACAILLGVQEGFCGCLTTVSTWVVELNGLGKKAAWMYGLWSVAIALGGMVAIMGGLGWTIGFENPVCG